MSTDRTFEAMTIREIQGSLVTDSYVALGAALTEPVYIMWLFSSSDETVLISEDGINDHYRLVSGDSRPIDLQTNKVDQRMGAKGTGVQFYIKGVAGALPSNGFVWLEGQTL